MDGERMIKMYVCAVLNNIPDFESEEEEKFYKKLKKEMEENHDAQWVVPSE